MINISVFSEGVSFPCKKITRKGLGSLAAAVAKRAGLDNVSITLIATDNEGIREINRRYRKKNRPTDVISFANRDGGFPEIDSPVEDLGDIYISLEKAGEQAGEFGVTLADEVKRLVIHGVLHLAGYDHEKSRKQALVMEQKEQEIFDSLG